jgi:hypothetical protein
MGVQLHEPRLRRDAAEIDGRVTYIWCSATRGTCGRDEVHVYLDDATRGPVKPHEGGGWPTFTITLTYHVADTEDIVEAQEFAEALR